MKNVARGRKYIRKECENFLKIKYKNTCKKLEEKNGFHNVSVIGKGKYRLRKTLESRHTGKIVDVDNKSKLLPRQYSILL